MNSSEKIIADAKKVFEIEAKSILDLKQYANDDFVGAVETILACKGKLIISGMGKSGHVGKKIAATLASTGTPSFFIHPGEAFHGDLGMITKDDVVLGISNSGETEEVIRLIPAIQRNGNKFIAMTGNADSTMSKNCDFYLNITVEEEACPLRLAPTSSTTATMAMGDALAVALMNQRDFQPEDFAQFHPGGSLGRKLLTKVGDVMIADNLPFVQLDTPFNELILKMTDGRLGLALVLKGDQLVGIVTDGDLRRAWSKKGVLVDAKASDLMTTNPKVVSSTMKLAEAEELLNQYKITSVVVADEGKVVGVMQVYNT